MNGLIFVDLKNFTLYHDIVVFDNNHNLITKKSVTLKNLSKEIIDCAKQYNIYSVRILGNSKYINKTIKELETTSLNKYNIALDIKAI